MKTNEQIESAIISKFANDVLGVSAIKEEHVNNQLSVSDSELAIAAAKKAAAAAAYKSKMPPGQYPDSRTSAFSPAAGAPIQSFPWKFHPLISHK